MNVRPEIIEFLKENIGSKLSDITLSSIFSDVSPWAKERKETMNKWDYIKLKSFCTMKETINKTKNNPTNGEHFHQ